MVVKTKDLQHHPQNSDIYDLSNIEDLVNSIRELDYYNLLLSIKESNT